MDQCKPNQRLPFFFYKQEDGRPQPLKAGGCTIHTGRTLHYTGPNVTKSPRRAYIVNYRPKSMIDFEREHNYDHGKEVNRHGALPSVGQPGLISYTLFALGKTYYALRQTCKLQKASQKFGEECKMSLRPAFYHAYAIWAYV